MVLYPLGESALSKTGKAPAEITLGAVKAGAVSAEDIKISRETLRTQGEIAQASNRPHLEQNFARAAELVDIPDAVILEMYGKLRPYRATKTELLQMADILLNRHHAPLCAKLVREAIEAYEKRGILK